MTTSTYTDFSLSIIIVFICHDMHVKMKNENRTTAGFCWYTFGLDPFRMESLRNQRIGERLVVDMYIVQVFERVFLGFYFPCQHSYVLLFLSQYSRKIDVLTQKRRYSRTSDGWKARGSENVIRERRMMEVRTPYGIWQCYKRQQAVMAALSRTSALRRSDTEELCLQHSSSWHQPQLLPDNLSRTTIDVDNPART